MKDDCEQCSYYIVVAVNKLMGICVCEDVELKTTQTSPVPRFIFRFALENLLL